MSGDPPSNYDELKSKGWLYDSVVSSVASQPLLDVITGPWKHVGDLACTALDLQIKLHKEVLLKAESRVNDIAATSSPHSILGKPSRTGTLFEAAATRIAQTIGSAEANEDVDAELDAINTIPPAVIARAFQSGWERLPYHAFCAARNRLKSQTPDGVDIDQWILTNETWLRDDRKRNWPWGLVAYSIHADTVFPGSSVVDGIRTVDRIELLDGRTILDFHRTKQLELQAGIEEFKASFETVTGGLLMGLDWTNVFVGGGMALSPLLCVKKDDVDKYKHSDIDIYIYGLGPVEANKKIEHIYQIWLRNLPPNQEPHVLRNSRTITFIAMYPTKRIQIILKLVSNPKEVLLNFDLDPCALGFDGKELWLLPRACRALQTGYTSFTMELIQGHYLGQRRASQQSRVFKYADKGFGIRFRPSYIESLPLYCENVSESKQHASNFDVIAAKSRDWIDLLIRRRDVKVYTHQLITERIRKSSDPADHTALQSFTRLMRHVALWERACTGDIELQDPRFAYETYDEHVSLAGYDETPQYEWGPKFNFKAFTGILDKSHYYERVQFILNLERAGLKDPNYELDRWYTQYKSWKPKNPQEAHSRIYSVYPNEIRRLILADTLEEILSSKGDSIVPLFIPNCVAEKCNKLVAEALSDHGFPASTTLLIPPLEPDVEIDLSPMGREGEDLRPMFWHIDATQAWQQIDRRIDEVYDILWAFRAANTSFEASTDKRTHALITQLSKRAIRSSIDHEFEAFARWVMRIPNPNEYHYESAWEDTPDPHAPNSEFPDFLGGFG